MDYGSSEEDVQNGEFRNPEQSQELPICNDLGQLALLSLQSLGLKQLSPTVPPEIELLSSLETVYLYGNDLNASLLDVAPSQMLQLSNLAVLRLDSNYLGGTTPSHLSSATSLKELNIGDNFVSGSIPTEIGLLSNLGILYLYQNDLNGTRIV